MASFPASAQTEMQKANLTKLVLEFTRNASQGAPCTYLKEDTNERCRTLYTIDKDLNYLIILSPKRDEGALAVCRLARISGVHSIKQDGKEAFPERMLANMTDLEKDLLAMVVYRKEPKDRKWLRLCLFFESQVARDNFMACIRVLSVYARRLASQAKAKKPKDLVSFLSCLACHCGRAQHGPLMHGMQLIEGIDTAFQIYVPQHLQDEDDEDEIDDDQLRVDSDGRIHIIWSLHHGQIRSHDCSQESLLGGVLPGDVVLSKIDLQRKSGDWLRKGDEGRVIGCSLDNQGVSISFGTTDDINLLPTQFEKKTCLGSDENARCLEATPTEAANLPIMSVDDRGKTQVGIHKCLKIYENLFVAGGCRMEYYSTTHKRWSPATVRVEVSSVMPLTVTYNAILGKDQERKDVMHFLRRPFDSNDLVEVFLERSRISTRSNDDSFVERESQNGYWLAGRIPGPPRASATLTGYTVRLDNSDSILESVHSWRIRHRYPRGQHVYVYKGLDEGWAPGVVDDSSSVNGLGAKRYTLRASDRKINNSLDTVHILSLRDDPSSNRRNQLQKRMQPVEAVDRRPRLHDCDIDPWVLVPVILDGAGHFEEFPSYLVRRHVEIKHSRWASRKTLLKKRVF